ELAEDTARRYRIDVERAHRMISDLWINEPALWEQAATSIDAARLKRTRAYKDAATKAKSRIYYGLRRYRDAPDESAVAGARLCALAGQNLGMTDAAVVEARDRIVATHISTRERLADLDEFFSALFAIAPAPASILDIGCGVQPLLYPFHAAGSSTRLYVAIDRDQTVIDAVQAWSRLLGTGRLEGRRWRLSEGFEHINGPEEGGLFDLALALKFVAVVARQEREKLDSLRQVPARRLLVTGAREAMVKRRSIAHREERVLREFADAHGFTPAARLETKSEVGLLLERR